MILTAEERRIKQEVAELMHATQSSFGSGPTSIMRAVHVLKPKPDVFWRFIEDLTVWTVRP